MSFSETQLTGKQLIAGTWVVGNNGTFQALNPADGKALEPIMTAADRQQVDAAVAAATDCAVQFANTSLAQRAEFLNACADEIMALGDTLTVRVMAETGYPQARAEGERGRTCGQLRMFADHLLKGEHLNIRIDHAQPDRTPLPRPDIRFINQAIGPVAVFGASNFPLAFSVAGGDTASALAAGCPVIVKAHNSHPGTSELVAQAIDRAVKSCGLPGGVFSLLLGSGTDVGAALVKAPGMKAVGFTGSYTGGMALFKMAAERPEPIPVFAEMGSVNPVVLLPQALNESAATIAENFVASLTLGVGQFCVNPGLVIALEDGDSGLNQFIDAAAEALAKVNAGVMLNQNIQKSYLHGIEQLRAQPGVSEVGQGMSVNATEQEDGFHCQAGLLTVNANDFLNNSTLREEVFGPVSLVVKCQDYKQLLTVIESLQGQLTGTVHCTESELAASEQLVTLLRQRVGRLVINGFPTGVEVCDAMMHGGPFPAATDSRFTSVGTAAIARFLRPICFQNYPQALLPDALKDSNPLHLPRIVNGSRG